PPSSPDSRRTRCPVVGSIQSDGGGCASAPELARVRAKIKLGGKRYGFMGDGPSCSAWNLECPHCCSPSWLRGGEIALHLHRLERISPLLHEALARLVGRVARQVPRFRFPGRGGPARFHATVRYLPLALAGHPVEGIGPAPPAAGPEFVDPEPLVNLDLPLA